MMKNINQYRNYLLPLLVRAIDLVVTMWIETNLDLAKILRKHP